MFNPVVTVGEVRSHVPCGRWPDDILRSVLGDGLPLIDCLRMESVIYDDRIWLFSKVVPPSLARLFACDCAERALLRERAAGREPDKRRLDTIDVGRRHARGKATDREFAAANEGIDVYWMSLVEWIAAWSTARWAALASTTEDDDDRQWQIAHAIEMCEQWEGE